MDSLLDSGISLSPSYRQLNNELRFESKRLQTFRDWPVDAPIEPARVAKAGFYFTGNGCEVQCFACNGKVSNWDYGDQAVARHRQMNPSCPFVLNRSSNVPLQSETESTWIDIQSPPSFQFRASQSSSSPRQSQSLESQLIVSSTEGQGDSPDESQHSEGYGSDHTTPQTPSADVRFSPPSSNNSPQPASGMSLDSVRDADFRSTGRSFLSHHEWMYLKREDVRLRTFDDRFTATFLSPMSLAKAGFFYLGVADQVQCAFCRGVVRDWEINDDPAREHQRLFPSCPFVLGLAVGNVRLGEDVADRHSIVERTASLPMPQNTNNGFGASQRFVPQIRSGAIPDTDVRPPRNMQLNALIGENLEDLGITKHSGPRYPNYATIEARMKTFGKWPPNLKQTPRAMAQAGFYYLGVNDHVNCFHCGSGLRNWEPEDDPWLEHARWFPQCRFLILMKGEDYIKEVALNTASASNASLRARAKPPLPNTPGQPTSRTSPREVSEAELQALIDSPVAQTVLAMGVDLSRVKQAYAFQMRTTGRPFATVDSLLEAAIEVQHLNEHRQALEDRSYETVEWSNASSSAVRAPTTRLSPEPLWEAAETPSSTTTDRTDIRSNSHVEEIVTADTIGKSEESEAQESAQNKTSAPPTGSSSAADRTQVLEEEIRRLKEARICKVCLDEEVSIAYIPCGHIVTCVQCAAALDHCPLCRKSIKGTVRIFFS